MTPDSEVSRVMSSLFGDIRAQQQHQASVVSPMPKWVICHRCDGDGAHSHHLGVVDPEDCSPEEWDDYMAGGHDRPCECCGGTGKLAAGGHA